MRAAAARWTPIAAAIPLLLAPFSAGAQREVEWDPAWTRVQPWEYVAGPVMLGGGLALRFAVPQVDRNWQGGILFDDAFIDAFAVRSSFRGTVATTSDVVFYGAMAYRLVDSALLPGLIHGSWDVGLQMSFIDLEALGLLAIVLWGSQTVVARERPFMDRCRNDPTFADDKDCMQEEEQNRSFIAGHTAVGVAAAALTCLHHSHLPLYGGGVGDDLACGLTIGAAVLNGLGRVLAEKHYASDLVLGIGLGLFTGYVVPKTLHYGWGRSTARERDTGVGMLVLPVFTGERVGLVLQGRL